LKYESKDVYNNTIDINSEGYNDSFTEIDSDLNELQEFCNMAVRSNIKEMKCGIGRHRKKRN
jgi:hypothetical protein